MQTDENGLVLVQSHTHNELEVGVLLHQVRGLRFYDIYYACLVTEGHDCTAHHVLQSHHATKQTQLGLSRLDLLLIDHFLNLVKSERSRDCVDHALGFGLLSCVCFIAL